LGFSQEVTMPIRANANTKNTVMAAIRFMEHSFGLLVRQCSDDVSAA
jgi:hypothetical protein